MLDILKIKKIEKLEKLKKIEKLSSMTVFTTDQILDFSIQATRVAQARAIHNLGSLISDRSVIELETEVEALKKQVMTLEDSIDIMSKEIMKKDEI